MNDPVGFSLKQALSYSLLSIDFPPSLNRVSQLLLSQPLAWSFGTQQPQLLIFICPPTYLACKRSRRKVLLQPTPPLHGVGSILPDGDAVFYFLASSHCTVWVSWWRWRLPHKAGALCSYRISPLNTLAVWEEPFTSWNVKAVIGLERLVLASLCNDAGLSKILFSLCYMDWSEYTGSMTPVYLVWCQSS